MRRTIITAALLALAACSNMDANEHGGVVNYNGLATTRDRAVAQIEAHCRRYGKVARNTDLPPVSNVARPIQWQFQCVTP